MGAKIIKNNDCTKQLIKKSSFFLLKFAL